MSESIQKSLPESASTEAAAGGAEAQSSVVAQEFEYRARPGWLMERVEYAGYLLGYGAVRALGPRWSGAWIDWMMRNIGPQLGLAKRAHGNFDLVRPHYDAEARRRIIRGVFGNFARTGFEYAALPHLAREAANWRVEGLEHLTAAREAAGGKLIVASAHFGNWEAVRAMTAHHGAPLGLIYRAFNNKYVDQHINRKMTDIGWPVFRKGAAGGRELFRHVRAGGGAMILVDQRLGGAPIIDFMGRPAETSLAAAQMARTLKAPLVPASALRVKGGFVVRFEEPVPPGRPDEMMAEVNRRVEHWVDEAPEQWLWMHRRWKVRSAKRPRKFGSSHESDRSPTS